jgi:hypothetical protein
MSEVIKLFFIDRTPIIIPPATGMTPEEEAALEKRRLRCERIQRRERIEVAAFVVFLFGVAPIAANIIHQWLWP